MPFCSIATLPSDSPSGAWLFGSGGREIDDAPSTLFIPTSSASASCGGLRLSSNILQGYVFFHNSDAFYFDCFNIENVPTEQFFLSERSANRRFNYF